MRRLFHGFWSTPNAAGDPSCGGIRGMVTIIEARPAITPKAGDGQGKWIVKIVSGGAVYWTIFRGNFLDAPL